MSIFTRWNKLYLDQLIVFLLAVIALFYFAYYEYYYLVVSEIVIYLGQLNSGRRYFTTHFSWKQKIILIGVLLLVAPVLIYISKDYQIDSMNYFDIDVDVFVGVVVLFFIYLLVLLNSLWVKKR